VIDPEDDGSANLVRRVMPLPPIPVAERYPAVLPWTDDNAREADLKA
jgi:hypothetical protein